MAAATATISTFAQHMYAGEFKDIPAEQTIAIAFAHNYAAAG